MNIISKFILILSAESSIISSFIFISYDAINVFAKLQANCFKKKGREREREHEIERVC